MTILIPEIWLIWELLRRGLLYIIHFFGTGAQVSRQTADELLAVCCWQCSESLTAAMMMSLGTGAGLCCAQQQWADRCLTDWQTVVHQQQPQAPLPYSTVVCCWTALHSVTQNSAAVSAVSLSSDKFNGSQSRPVHAKISQFRYQNYSFAAQSA